MPIIILTVSFIAESVLLLGIGYAVFRVVAPPSRLSARVVVAAVLGAGAVASAMALVGVTIGWAPWLWPTLAALSLLAAFGAPSAWRDARALASAVREWWRGAGLVERALVIIGLGVPLVHILLAGLPPTATDDMRTYLRHAQLMALSGHLRAVEDSLYSELPLNREMFSVLGFRLWDARLAQLLGVPFAFVLSGVTAALTDRLFGRKAAAASFALVAVLPVYGRLASSGKTDVLAILFIAAALLMLEEASRERSLTPTVLLVGLLFGFALGTKPTTVFYGVLLVFWAVRAWLTTPEEGRPTMAQVGRLISIASGGFLIAYSPWLLREWIEFGNPIHTYVAGSDSTRALSMGQGPLDRLLLAFRVPWLLTFVHVPNRTNIPVVLWLLAIAGVWGGWRESGWRWSLAGLAVVILVFTQFYVATAMISVRFLLAGFLLLVALAASGVAAILALRWKWARVGLGTILVAFLGWQAARSIVIGPDSLAVLAGVRPPETYVRKWVSSRDLIDWARTNWTWEDRVWSVDMAHLIYYDARLFHSSASRTGQALVRSADPCAAMDSLGIGYVIAGPGTRNIYPGGVPAFRRMAAGCLDSIYTTDNGWFTVYRRLPAQ